jgi:hypothetical protein
MAQRFERRYQLVEIAGESSKRLAPPSLGGMNREDLFTIPCRRRRNGLLRRCSLREVRLSIARDPERRPPTAASIEALV